MLLYATQVRWLEQKRTVYGLVIRLPLTNAVYDSCIPAGAASVARQCARLEPTLCVPRQGLVEEPPLYPDHLLHDMIRTALQPAPPPAGFGDDLGFSGFGDGDFAGSDPVDWRRGSLDFEDEYGVEMDPLSGQGGSRGSPPMDGRQGGAENYPEWPERGGVSEAQQFSFNSDR